MQPHLVIDEESLSTSIDSDVTEIMFKDNITYQISWGGTLLGTFDVAISSDYDKLNPSAATWDSLPLSPAPVAAGAPDSWTIDLSQLGSKFIKLSFTRTSGSGFLKARISGKAT